MLFESINTTNADDALFAKVRAYAGKEWGTKLVSIKALRKRYLILQGYRCAYCQSVIEADANGHRELEHILPKSPSDDTTHARNNDLDKRRQTYGYKNFSFEPLNLCLACKVCNPKKGTFDPLLDRGTSPLKYPGKGKFFWFHPHFDLYSDHIKINENFTFTKITEQGGAVITACGMDDAKLLAERFLSRAESTVVRNKHAKFDQLVNAVSNDIVQQKFGVEQGLASLMKEYPNMDGGMGISMLQLWCAHLEDYDNLPLREKACSAVQIVSTSLKKVI
jgi:5-methylcytosine-specific restriction endonuclease McrA